MDHGDRYRQPGLAQYAQIGQQPYNGAQNQLPTLPPLHGAGFAPMSYGGHSSNPQTPHTPVTSAPNGAASMQQHPPLRPLQPSPSSFMPMSSGYSQAPPLSTAGAPHSNAHQLAPSQGLAMSHASLYPHPPVLANQEPEPLHVVGQQGRRGVLPTHPGRPAPAAGKTPTNATKNAEGKYECPHCNKTYLHLKHLKRHLLRHTGERPYSCHLCKDTFSRSDILKRHFQKCSIRRGNPTGANHLQHAQNHLKNRQPTGPEQNSYLNHMPNTSMSYSDAGYSMGMPQMPPVGPNGFSDSLPSIANHQSMSARTSRSNSLIRPGSGMDNENRRSMSALEFNNQRMNFNDFRPDALSNDYAAQQNQNASAVSGSNNHYNYEHPAANNNALANNGMPVKTEGPDATAYGVQPLPNVDGLSNGQDSSLWRNGTFNGDSHLMTSSTTSDDTPNDTLLGLFPPASGFLNSSSALNSWSFGQTTSNPLQQKTQSLVAFCFPDAASLTPGSSEADSYNMLRGILMGDNIRAFLDDYRHYHSHWPIIHAPTFDPLSADLSLVLSMCCVGAVYSDRLRPEDVRWLMDVVRAAILKSSQIFNSSLSEQQTGNVLFTSSVHVEELQALMLLHSLFLWHGSQKQRQRARNDFGALANLGRRAGLLQSIPRGQPNSSALHQPGPVTGDEVNTWDWSSWIENEKRVRLMAYIFLIDACSTIYFNTKPQFDVYELKIPLPTDDAAWEARSAEECASALGLRGQSAQIGNVCGSRRAKQLSIPEALQVLYGAGHNRFPERATNVFGKFILIHVIHIQIYNTQRQLLRPGSTSGASTPRDGSATPPRAVSEQAQQLLRSTFNALELWKKVWDVDLAIQFPQHERRHGFCRDGVHYYFLAQIFLRSSRPQEWAAPADLRCRQVFHLLKQIRAHVASDSAQKGIDLGSINTISDDFAVADLTLNMRSLFTPIDDHPVSTPTNHARPQYPYTLPLTS
ncbi:fungal-specific transcription factor domain-containing protein [Ampelomyces quisqualis]|uniref:Fungal-specific transcription factor domain-containing protein n=1 Tax=Ampelomyces quisqualis TaxID=50730 RepID=A0A6A5QD22_AMPQU|nr:fungal-specific transcription factor domain-containing protein [Ampelomyces quisqualis]